ncbi:DUF3043 domain-containing protein [Blastococcus sp. CT_GayMR19]|uniref:DUF3043 domain-containing protein n=1 Tax=Blastococcus sp. CT_GayMR19 TaxID=2559608 RepID=UPI001073F2F4|nr:DUF3043 domain-containing protein [Blastococcus sp. CT_GayMR19]TFV77654.1 DUF3043 domain-containing protein [Blastococcus sp. CT_GayMR19]
MSGKRRPGGRGSSGSTRRPPAPRRSRQGTATTPYGEPNDVDLHPRDRGPVRAFVRDVVDARRGPVGLLLPAAGITVTCAFAPASDLQRYLLLGSLVLLAAVAVDAVLLGVEVTRRARAQFPGEDVPGPSTAWYAFLRAHRSRGARRPPPRVMPGRRPSPPR